MKSGCWTKTDTSSVDTQSNMEIVKNAIIESTSLGELGRGFSSFIHVSYGGSSQGYGGYSIKDEYCYKWVKGVTEAVGVERWEELPGTHVRVVVENNEPGGGRIIRIGHILNDTWYSMK